MRSAWIGLALTAAWLACARSSVVAQQQMDESKVVKENKLTEKELPKVVLEAFRKEAERADGRMNEFVVKIMGSGKKFYEVELKLKNGSERDFVVDAQGNPTRVTNEDSAPPSDRWMRKGDWQDSFDVSRRKFSPTGRNRYLVLEPGYQLVLEGKEKGQNVTVVITVLDETRKIAGVETRVVEERESKNGKLVEVSRNFMACCTESGSIFYFGEEVDDYENGKIVGHGGAWIAGKGGAQAGILMPGEPLVGARYYQEIAAKVAMDRAEILGFMKEEMKTPAGDFTGCLVVEESTPLEPGVKDHKVYAPGIGVVFDGGLRLTKHGFVKKKAGKQ